MRRGKPTPPIVLPPLPPLGASDDIASATTPAASTQTVPSRRDAAASGLTPDSQPGEPQPRDPMRTLDVRPLAMWQRTAEIAAILSSSDARIRELMAASTYPLAAYDRFRRDNPVRPPPGGLPSANELVAVVDASVAAPFLVRETLRSLQSQSVDDWTAIVVAPAATQAHPVGSFGDIDPRIRFVAPGDVALPGGACLLLSAGTALDQHAIAWFAFAAQRTGAEAVFADHDHGVSDADLGALRADPWFYAALDRASLDWLPAPAVLWVDAALVAASTPVFDGSERWRRDLLTHSAGAVAHVPRLIASVIELPITARGGQDRPDDGIAGRLGPVAPLLRIAAAPPSERRIAVVIPTRDGAELLERAVTSLRQTARAPDRLDIVVVDNRSVAEETRRLLARFAAEGLARSHRFDKPFNWGLVNNEGAAESDAEFLVLANNDIEMLSRGWDDTLVAALTTPGVGAVGARLLYPNGTVQHGGMVFGMAPDHTEHEGRARAVADPGPNRRLVTPRTVAAVTGAFLGIARERFEALGGVDTVMGVAHSDIDLCLRIRELGLTIRYEPRIETIHFESVTRGVNSTKADVAWDESERTDLVARWGSAMTEDIGVSPYWGRAGHPSETIREPTMIEVVRHIDRTGRTLPWVPTRADAQGDAAWRAEALG